MDFRLCLPSRWVWVGEDLLMFVILGLCVLCRVGFGVLSVWIVSVLVEYVFCSWVLVNVVGFDCGC